MCRLEVLINLYSSELCGQRCKLIDQTTHFCNLSENPRAHKNKNRHSPPQKTQNTPPKTRNFMDMVFLAERTHFSRRPKNWRSHFRPQNCGQKIYGHEDFSESGLEVRPSRAIGCELLRSTFASQHQTISDARVGARGSPSIVLGSHALCPSSTCLIACL